MSFVFEVKSKLKDKQAKVKYAVQRMLTSQEGYFANFGKI
jgi:hypothetical protein